MRLSAQAGFTLIEIMIVLAIIAGVLTLATPYMTTRNSQQKGFLRQLTILSREIHTRAKLNGTAYRIVIDMGETSNDGSRPSQKIWVEKASGKVVLNDREEDEARSRAKDPEKAKERDPRGFEPAPEFTKNLKEIPPGILFDRVELTRLKSPVTEGKAFIHYLPEGLVDEAVIHIKGVREQAWSLAIHPLTGKAELISKTVSLKEIRDQ